jgi:hypothetical protein
MERLAAFGLMQGEGAELRREAVPSALAAESGLMSAETS